MLHAPNICSKEALQQRSRTQRKRDQPHPRSYLILAQGLQITFLNQSLSLSLSPSPSPSLCVSNFGCLTWHLMQHWTSFPSGIDFIYFLLPSIRRIKSLSPFSVRSLSQPGTPGFCFDLCPLQLNGHCHCLGRKEENILCAARSMNPEFLEGQESFEITPSSHIIRSSGKYRFSRLRPTSHASCAICHPQDRVGTQL